MNDADFLYSRVVGDRYVAVITMTFGRARVVVGRLRWPDTYDDGW